MDAEITRDWKKSSYSFEKDLACVELAGTSAKVLVRDSTQNGQGPILSFSRTDFAELISQVKAL